MVNASESLPNWAFFVTDNKAPGKGQYVFFAPPQGEIVRRHFGPDQGPFGKRVIGMPGSVVEHRGEWVYVDGVRTAHMKPRTRFGETLHPGPREWCPKTATTSARRIPMASTAVTPRSGSPVARRSLAPGYPSCEARGRPSDRSDAAQPFGCSALRHERHGARLSLIHI